MREAVRKQRYEKKKRKNRIQFILLIIIFVISMVVLAYKLYEHYKDSEANREIREELNVIYEEVKDEPPEVKEKTKIEKLEELQKINPDIVALIEIEGTNINYPVLQGENNSYYMTHNYKKEKSKDGALFLDKDYDWNIPSTNLLIYGHNNIGSSEMFVELTKYKKESFYKEHKIINFITNKEEAQFEIISVFLSRVYYQYEKNVFRYYYFINADTKKEYDSYVNNCKKASLYDIEATAEFGDELMTLTTCEYSQSNGRLAVVAKKIVK